MNHNHKADGKFGQLSFFGRLKARIVFTLNWLWFMFKWRVLPLAIVSVATFAYFSFGGFRNESIAYAQALPITHTIEQGKTIDQLEDEFMDELAHHENEGGLPAYLDDNSHGTLSKKDKLSYGCLAYKLSTVERHYKGIHGETIGDLDAALLALDCPKAKALAKEAIFGKLNAISEWMAATDKMEMKVAVLREMAN